MVRGILNRTPSKRASCPTCARVRPFGMLCHPSSVLVERKNKNHLCGEHAGAMVVPEVSPERTCMLEIFLVVPRVGPL